MRRFLLFSMGLLTMASCSKESTSVNTPALERVTLVSSVENQVSKATLSSKTWYWAPGDAIGVYFYDGGGDQATNTFYLKENVSTTIGTFEYKGDDIYENRKWNVGAVYPKFDNAIWWIDAASDHVANIELKTSYDYTSGVVLMPLVANLKSGGARPTSVAFKQVASCVKVTLNSVPIGTKTITLSADKTIAGDCNIKISDVGTGTLSNYANSSKSVSFVLSSALTSSQNGMVFYFPILPVSDPTFTISVKDTDDHVLWSKTKAFTGESTLTLGRGDILEMAATSVSTKTLTVGIATYIGSPSTTYIHAWGGHARTGTDYQVKRDGSRTITGTRDKHSSASQTYNAYTATVPNDIDGFNIKYGEQWSSNASNTSQTGYIYEWGGVYYIFFTD